MDWTLNVSVHESASPEFLREQVLAALRASRIHPHLLYAGLRQTTLWRTLHHSVSPAQRDDGCRAIYEAAFERVSTGIRGNVAHVISLACGDGSKDVRCLKRLRDRNRTVMYTPVDLSLELVLSATRLATAELRGIQPTPLLCDLPRCSVLPAILKALDPSGAERVLLFLGTIHNFWPPDILRPLLYPLRAQDQLLISANLAPGDSYDESLERILGQYDNGPTRRWLMGALSELGLNEADGALSFAIAPSAEPTLKRIEAVFEMGRSRTVKVYDMELQLQAGQRLEVFFSHRFTVPHLEQFLTSSGLELMETWIGANGEEGLFLCRRAAA